MSLEEEEAGSHGGEDYRDTVRQLDWFYGLVKRQILRYQSPTTGRTLAACAVYYIILRKNKQLQRIRYPKIVSNYWKIFELLDDNSVKLFHFSDPKICHQQSFSQPPASCLQ